MVLDETLKPADELSILDSVDAVLLLFQPRLLQTRPNRHKVKVMLQSWKPEHTNVFQQLEEEILGNFVVTLSYLVQATLKKLTPILDYSSIMTFQKWHAMVHAFQ